MTVKTEDLSIRWHLQVNLRHAHAAGAARRAVFTCAAATWALALSARASVSCTACNEGGFSVPGEVAAILL